MSESSKQHWYWVGPPESPFLSRLTDWMVDQTQSETKQSSWQLDLIEVGSAICVADTDAHAFVWSIGESGIADSIERISRTSRSHPQAIQLSTGLVSPKERTLLLEAGTQLHLQHPHHLKAVLDRLHRTLPDPTQGGQPKFG